MRKIADFVAASILNSGYKTISLMKQFMKPVIESSASNFCEEVNKRRLNARKFRNTIKVQRNSIITKSSFKTKLMKVSEPEAA